MVLTSGTPCKDLRHPRGSPVYAVRKAAPDQGKPNSVGCGVSWRGGVTCRTGISMFWLCSIHTTLVHRTPAHRPGRGLWKRILRLF